MPRKSPRVCGHCSKTHKSGETCPKVAHANQERKARHDAKRPSARDRGYTREWELASKQFLLVFNSCVRCGQHASVVDHINPHKGNMKLFWDRKNWQPMCSHCHNSAKQSEERRATGTR